MKNIGIIGCGYNGAHLARVLSERGYTVTVLEKNPDMFEGISGAFGIRLHAGPHYPRSPKTRKSCHRDFERFMEIYPELIVQHEYSVYGLGEKDADNYESKVSAKEFMEVCREFKNAEKIDPEKWGYKNLLCAMNIKEEPSMIVGEPLRNVFRKHLKNIDILFNCTVEKLEETDDKIEIEATLKNGNKIDRKKMEFDYVINATSYQSLLPKEPPPFDMDVVYQPCLALIYEDKEPTEKPFSFIVMDGAFPCLMPLLDSEMDTRRKYILTHGKYTIIDSCTNPQSARALLERLNSDKKFVDENIRPLAEAEMIKFWPQFGQGRFQYMGWQGTVLAKIKSEKEFRSGFVFGKGRIGFMFPGKVDNSCASADESIALIEKSINILTKGGYEYVQGGVLDDSLVEIREKPIHAERNTGSLQTYRKLLETEERKVPTLFPPAPTEASKDVEVEFMSKKGQTL